jgi:signal transduction histidine kinase
VTWPVRFPTGEGRLVFAPPGPPPPPAFGTRIVPLVLIVVAVSSLLLARSLTRPLQKLSSAARAFGSGDLGARVALARSDELGDVSRSFDEMAERVTELLRAEKELIANVSHELRTPLARIRVAMDLATEGDAEVAKASLADIAEDLDELERLIADVLTAARLDLGDGSAPAGTPPLRRERVDVHELLDHAASRFRTAHADRPLDVRLEDDLPSVDGDPVLLRRVVDNLLENAHKYTEQRAEPIALVARADGDVEIEIIDHGVGISAADLPQVFRPFFRADRSRTRATGGLGLGLALTKRIVDAHGGSIELTSAPGLGTRAVVRLPVRPDVVVDSGRS